MATTNKTLRDHAEQLAGALSYDPSSDWRSSGDYRERDAHPSRHPEGCAMVIAQLYT